MMAEMKMNEFLEELSSEKPVPGGGGVSAYAAALGMSLGNMVAHLTTGKKKYAANQKEIEDIMEEAEKLTVYLQQCMDKDAEAFEPLSKAYGLPKTTKEECEKREVVMEECLLRGVLAGDKLDIVHEEEVGAAVFAAELHIFAFGKIDERWFCLSAKNDE